MASVARINYENPEIHSIEAPKKSTEWTQAKIKQIALYVFAFLLICAGIAACLLLPTPYSLFPAAAALPALKMTHSASEIKDFEDPIKLQGYKILAARMTFQDLYEEFGLKIATENNLLTPQALKDKFDIQLRDMDFSSVSKAFNLDQLSNYKVASPEHIALLRKFKSSEIQCRNDYETAIKSGANQTRARFIFHRQLNALDKEYNQFKKFV